MKTNKIFNIGSLLLLMLCCLTACEDAGDKIFLSDVEGSELVATSEKVILSQELSKQIVLSLVWNKSGELAVSDPDMSAPNVLKYYMQVSAQADFANYSEELLGTTLSKAYSGSDLNVVAGNLGLEANVEAPVYFRINASRGYNAPTYSNVVAVHVTPYTIDMTVGQILDADKKDTGFSLYSPGSDGLYKGFMGAAAWANFFLQEGNGTTWGNDAVTGTPFRLSSDAGSWNCWFPGIGGCYYVVVNTKNKEWSSLWIESMKSSGAFAADMIFDRKTVKWTAPFTATEAGTLQVKLNATGKQYDLSTGTDDALAKNASLAFSQNGTSLVLAAQAQDITVSVPKAGQYILEIDLSNPRDWTYKAEEGEIVVPDPVYEKLYLPGIDDGHTGGSWNFNHSIALYHPDNKTYAGVIDVNSKWGYSFNVEADNWDDKYTMANGGSAYEGALEFKGANNVSAPTPGLYLIEASLTEMKYKLTAVGTQVYVLGLDDAWNFDIPLTATSTAGVYTGQISFGKVSKDGCRIYLKNGDWTYWFGGKAEKLYYNGENIKDDATLAPGAYTMTVDLINATYSIKP